MKIIVTGGAGFIGSHIADAYVKAGHKVAVIDNLATGFRKNVNKKAKFYKADIRNQKSIEGIFRKEKPEIVNHHAAIAAVAESLRNPAKTLGVNVLGTVNLLSLFGKYGRGDKRKFIFASTGGAMYGDPKHIPADDDAPTFPLSPYGLSKLLAEESIRFYSEFHNLNYCIFRYANVHGPRQNPLGEAGVVAIFSRLMKSDKQPVIFGDGTKTRDYVYVSDVVNANLLALEKGSNVVMNLGTGKETKDIAVFQAIADELGFKQKPIHTAFRKGELLRSALRASRAKRVLGWEPEIEFEEGVRKTLTTLA